MTSQTKMIRRGLMLATAIGGAATLAAQADAAAFYLQEQLVKASGRAFSGEVSEQGAQQMWWNPAAAGGISGIQTYFGVNAIIPRAKAVNRGSALVRPGLNTGIPGVPVIGSSTLPVGGDQTVKNPINNGYLPNGGFAVPINEHFTFGFTATSPYSFTTNYDGDDWARYAADKTRLRTYDMQPVIAFSTGGPGGQISIGAGPNIEYTKATLSNKLPDPLNPLGPDGEQTLKGDGWDVGYSFGFQFHNEKVDIGASYKSKIKHNLKGTLDISGITGLAQTLATLTGSTINEHITGTKATFTTPWQVNLGMRYHVTPQFTLNGQVTRFGWDKFNAINLTQLGVAIPENYNNTWSYAVGFDYDVTPRWTVRGGVQRDLSPIHAGDRDPRVPDGNRWNFAAGTSYKLTQKFTVDAAFSYDKIKSEPIDKLEAAYPGTPFQTVIVNNGYLHKASALVFGLGGRFDF